MSATAVTRTRHRGRCSQIRFAWFSVSVIGVMPDDVLHIAESLAEHAAKRRSRDPGELPPGDRHHVTGRDAAQDRRDTIDQVLDGWHPANDTMKSIAGITRKP